MTEIAGVTIGIVKSFEDPHGEGRIELEFPWLPGATRSAWASVAAPLAGKERGQFFIPEPDDEVLVAFEQGNFENPYILGYLWNGVDLPPESDRANRVIVTPGKHSLRFEDGESKKIVIRSSSGHTITLDDASSAPTVSIVTKGGQSVTLDDTQKSIAITTNSGDQAITLSDTEHSAEIKGGQRTISLRSGTVQIT